MIIHLDKSNYSWIKPLLPIDAIGLGSDGDGGYVTSKAAVMNSNLLISFGMGNNIDFESDFLKLNPDAHVVIIDHSVPNINLKFLVKSFVTSLVNLNFLHFSISHKFYLNYNNF